MKLRWQGTIKRCKSSKKAQIKKEIESQMIDFDWVKYRPKSET